MQSIGDMAQSFLMRHQQTKLREQINVLGIELSTGIVADRSAHLGGDLSVLATLDRSLMALEGFRIASAEATYVTDVMQNSLGQMQDRIEALSPRLLNAELIVSDTLRASMARDAQTTLEATLANLNVSAAGRVVFGGVAADRPAMADADTILAALRIELAGETTLVGINTKLDAWFDSAGGGFETDAYTGSTTSVDDTRLSATDSASLDVRADDPVFRDMIKALSLAVLSNDSAFVLPPDLQKEMLLSAGEQIVNAQTSLTDLRASIGSLQARIEETETRNASERTATQLARLKLIGADQYESAVRLQDAQVQIEALYSVTARAARMSFVEFMR